MIEGNYRTDVVHPSRAMFWCEIGALTFHTLKWAGLGALAFYLVVTLLGGRLP